MENTPALYEVAEIAEILREIGALFVAIIFLLIVSLLTHWISVFMVEIKAERQIKMIEEEKENKEKTQSGDCEEI